MKQRLITAIIMLSCICASAMDGIAVTCWYTGKYSGGKAEMSSFTIKDDKVVSEKILYGHYDDSNIKQYLVSPSIDPGGTHAVFGRMHSDKSAGTTVYYLSMISLETGDIKNIAQITGGEPETIWWLHDGSIAVLVGKCRLDRYYLSKSGASTTVNAKLMGKFKYGPQVGKMLEYVDMSMDGKIISFRVWGGNICAGGEKMSGSGIGPIPDNPNTLIDYQSNEFINPKGCGNAVSPQGDLHATFGGSGHTSFSTKTYPGNEGVYACTRDSLVKWVNGTYASGYNNFCGFDLGQGWSVNSRKWRVVSVGCDGRFAKSGIADQFVFSPQLHKAINTTLHCQSQKLAKHSRGDVWVSSKDDVDEELWHYVEKRETSKAHWDGIMAGLSDDAGIIPVEIIRRDAQQKKMNIASATRQGISFATGRARRISLHTLSGRLLWSAQTSRRTIRLPAHVSHAGIIIARIKEGTNLEAIKIAK